MVKKIANLETRTDTILERIRDIEGIKWDGEIAIALKTGKNTVSNWRQRNNISYSKVAEYGREKGISLEWLINGKGPVHIRDFGVADPGAIYEVETDQDAVYTIAAMATTYCLENGIQLPENKIEGIVKLIHRDAIATGQAKISRQRVEELIELAR